MKKNLITSVVAMAILALSCSKNLDSIQPVKASLSTAGNGTTIARTGTTISNAKGVGVDTSTVSGGGGSGGTSGGGSGSGTSGNGSNHIPPTPAPTTVLNYIGTFPLPVASPTNNPITDAASVLPTSTWAIKFIVNGVKVTTYDNVPFKFDLGTLNGWNTSTADPHGGRNPVGFWYAYGTTSFYQGSITLAYCTIDKSFQALRGTYLLNPASTENSVILDRVGIDGHITFYR